MWTGNRERKIHEVGKIGRCQAKVCYAKKCVFSSCTLGVLEILARECHGSRHFLSDYEGWIGWQWTWQQEDQLGICYQGSVEPEGLN